MSRVNSFRAHNAMWEIKYFKKRLHKRISSSLNPRDLALTTDKLKHFAVQQRGGCEIGIRLNVMRMYRSTSSVKKEQAWNTPACDLGPDTRATCDRPHAPDRRIICNIAWKLQNSHLGNLLRTTEWNHQRSRRTSWGNVEGVVAVTLEPRK